MRLQSPRQVLALETSSLVLWTEGDLDETRMLAMYCFDNPQDRRPGSSGRPHYAGHRRLARLFPLHAGGFGWGICYGDVYREPTADEYQKLCRHLLEHEPELFRSCGFTEADAQAYLPKVGRTFEAPMAKVKKPEMIETRRTHLNYDYLR